MTDPPTFLFCFVRQSSDWTKTVNGCFLSVANVTAALIKFFVSVFVFFHPEFRLQAQCVPFFFVFFVFCKSESGTV